MTVRRRKGGKKRGPGHSSLKTTQRYIRRLQMEWCFDEAREKDKRFGSWQPLGSEYLKKIRGDVEWKQ